ncbi:MAG: 4-amino-4-deoxy-L-arabinose transferase [Allomuricauda sp.]|nr:MAG: 4-amino-4-deoxy-L-arabinose transferase [Allomuricauda sp.]
MGQKFPRLFLILLGLFFILNILQAAFTELLFDEAYYWYYAQQLAWGYFDHPPMVALMVRLGEIAFEGELGVRLVSCFMGAGTFLLLWCLIDYPKKRQYVIHFFLLLFSMALVNAYGFFTLPDTPLLFFTALFLYLYKQFTEKRGVALAIGLGLVMAALVYSKYHGVLIILFVFASNWRLIKDALAWVAVAVSLLCFAPHLFWLAQNDFITINYHLFERPNHAYNFSEFTLGYLLNLVLVFGLLFPWAYQALFKSRSNGDMLIKALQYLSYGFILFFFLSSFTKRVQTQWIVVICIPIAVLTFKHLLTNQNTAKWVFRMGVISTLILMYARVWLVNDRLLPIYFETHGNKNWVGQLKSEINGIPAVFQNSYRRASMYAFYSGSASFSLNTTEKRQNQFTIDDSESRIQGKKIAYIAKNVEGHDFEYSKCDGTVIQGKFIPSFRSYRRLWCTVPDTPLTKEHLKNLEIALYNPYQEDIFRKDLDLYVAYLNKYKEPIELKKMERCNWQNESPYVKAEDTCLIKCAIPPPEDKNVHYIRLGISEHGLKAGINSKTLKLEQ